MSAPKVNYIGVSIPDFENDKIDSLVVLYEADRDLFYKAQEKNDMLSYQKSKAEGKSYDVTNFYNDVAEILNKNDNKKDLKKFQDYMAESSTKARAFFNKPQE